MKRIPRIKFPQRQKQPSGTTSRHHEAESGGVNEGKVFSSISPGGKACDQPKRTPLSQQEIEAILMGGCI